MTVPFFRVESIMQSILEVSQYFLTNLGQQRMRHNEYDHSRARECLGLALGFLMNYDEL